MKTPRSLSEILEILKHKPRSSGGNEYVSALGRLKDEWRAGEGLSDLASDAFPIRAVTLLEVLFRTLVDDIIRVKNPNAEELKEVTGTDFKLNLDYVVSLHDKRISLGELIAHSLPASDIDSMLSVINRLLPGFLRALPSVTQRQLFEEIPASPFISDFPKAMSCLKRLYQVRHILTHEFRSSRCYDTEEVEGFLDAAHCLALAAEHWIQTELYGPIPLTQGEMNESAYAVLKEEQEALAELCMRIRGLLPDGDDFYSLKVFDKEQQLWETYSKVAADIVASGAAGGSMEPFLRSVELTDLIQERIDRLRRRHGLAGHT